MPLLSLRIEPREVGLILDWLTMQLGCRREGNLEVHYALKEIPLREPGGFLAAAAAAGGEDAETHREVSLLQQMDHPNIVRYIESFTERDRESGCACLYIVMELVEGTSLLELINSHAEKKQRIPEAKIRDIAVQANGTQTSLRLACMHGAVLVLVHPHVADIAVQANGSTQTCIHSD